MTATATPPLTQTPMPVRLHSEPAVGYFEQTGPASLILGSFFAVAVPMALVTLLTAGPANAVITWLYVWLFGITHFVITLSIYCNSANLSYFKSSSKTIITFFVVPILIFITFDMIHAFRVSTVWPLAALIFFGCVRCFDFFHLNRQTFGVLQMFKGRTKSKYPPALRRFENACLISLVALLMTTFLSGGVCPLLQAGGPLSLASLAILDGGVAVADLAILQFIWVVLLTVTAGLFVMVVRGHWSMANQNPNGRGFAPALAYFTLQCVGAVMASLYLPLYLAALAMHYVEYHVLMMPRCLKAPLNPDSSIDRRFARLRKFPVLFYMVILGLSVIVAGGAFIGMNAAMGMPIADFTSPISSLMLIALFDGIFVFHYFVEMYIWKFSDPHFRKMLAGLYFAPAAKPS